MIEVTAEHLRLSGWSSFDDGPEREVILGDSPSLCDSRNDYSPQHLGRTKLLFDFRNLTGGRRQGFFSLCSQERTGFPHPAPQVVEDMSFAAEYLEQRVDVGLQDVVHLVHKLLARARCGRMSAVSLLSAGSGDAEAVVEPEMVVRRTVISAKEVPTKLPMTSEYVTGPSSYLRGQDEQGMHGHLG